MADCATADSGISSVKTDTMPPSRLYLHNRDTNQGVNIFMEPIKWVNRVCLFVFGCYLCLF